MERMYRIGDADSGDADRFLGVSPFTLWRWDKEGKLQPIQVAQDSLYPESLLLKLLRQERHNAVTTYARVSSVKDWQMLKAVQRKKKDPKLKPVLQKSEFELDETLFSFGDYTTKKFDLWIKTYSGKKGEPDSYTGQKAYSVKLLA